jgi:DNA-binding MarR family transcriptional regulator
VNSNATTTDPRTAAIERVVHDLVPHMSQLTRLVSKQVHGEITRSEGAVLRTLSTGPKRVTELAELEGLAQPTTTILIKRLERSGWVARHRDPGDGRAVLVSLTADGERALELYRSQYRAVLRDRIAAMPDAQVAALADAVGALESLVVAMQQGEQR